MADQIDAPDVTANSADALQSAVAKQAAEFSQTVMQSGSAAKDVLGGFQSFVDNINKKSADTFADISSAVANKTEIANYPAGIARIWGYFDPNMSAKVQDERLTGAGMKLKEIQSNLANAQVAKDAALQAIQTDVETAHNKLTAATVPLSSLATAQGIDIAARQAPATLAETHARTQQALLSTRQGTIQLNTESASPDVLTKALDGSNPNIPAGEAQARLNQLDTQRLNIESISLANKSGQVDLEKKLRDELLMKHFTAHDLGDIITKMGDKDEVPLKAPGSTQPPVTFSKGELELAYNARKQAAQDVAENFGKTEGLFAGFQVKQAETLGKMQSIAIMNGGVLPPDLQAQWIASKQQIDAGLSYRVNPDGSKTPVGGSIKAANDILDQWQKTVDEHITQKVASAPNIEKPFIKEFLENNGKVSTANSADYTFSTARTPNALEGTPFEWFETGFSKTLNDTVQSRQNRMGGILTTGAGSGSGIDAYANMLADDKFIDRSQSVYDVLNKDIQIKPIGAALNQTISIPTRGLFRNSVMEDYSTKLLADLAQPVTPVADQITGKTLPPPANPYTGVLDINGRISSSYRKPDGSFNMGNLAAVLEQKTDLLHKQGTLPADQNLADLFLKQFVTRQGDYKKHFNETSPMKLRAFNQLINGDEPLKGSEGYVNDFIQARQKAQADISAANKAAALYSRNPMPNSIDMGTP